MREPNDCVEGLMEEANSFSLTLSGSDSMKAINVHFLRCHNKMLEVID